MLLLVWHKENIVGRRDQLFPEAISHTWLSQDFESRPLGASACKRFLSPVSGIPEVRPLECSLPCLERAALWTFFLVCFFPFVFPTARVSGPQAVNEHHTPMKKSTDHPSWNVIVCLGLDNVGMCSGTPPVTAEFTAASQQLSQLNSPKLLSLQT